VHGRHFDVDVAASEKVFSQRMPVSKNGAKEMCNGEKIKALGT